ncbi:MAG: hypothetical protein EOP64_08250 [Sphingomonas sp.]|nr:MAG: hypothetical protein EOP64_08250 [Sphingomonas sp.]
MLRSQGYRYELVIGSGELKHQLVCCAGEARWLWNLFLAHGQKRRARGEKLLTYNQMAAALTKLRAKPELAWLKAGSSAAQQRVLRNLADAWQRFFSKLADAPRMHKRGRHDAYGWSGRQHCEWDRKGRRVKVPKLGWLRYRGKRHAEGDLINVTLRRKGLRWYVSFGCEREVAAPKQQSIRRRIGLDMGIAVHTATSDGRFEAGPNALQAELARLAREQRKQSRRKKGSKRRKKQALKVSRLHQRIAHVRLDHLHKLTTKLAKNHGLVAIEDLRVKNMSKSARGTLAAPGKHVGAKAALNRRILDQGWGEMRRQLTYKAGWYGSHVVAVPPANTSRRCSSCRHTAKENRTSQARFCCTHCGTTTNADSNAAKNILLSGLALYSGRWGRGERTGRRRGCPANELCKPVFTTGIPVL